MKIQVVLTDEQRKILKKKNLSGNDSNEKGEVVEYIAEQVLLELEADEIYKYTDIQKQANIGDYKVMVEGKRINIEVKTSHEYNNKDKQAMDIFYFKYKQREGLIPYYQKKTTNDYEGWLYHTQANYLMCFSPDTYKIYIIKNYQELKQKIIEDTENYINSLNICEMTWYRKGHENYINDYLEGSVKQDTSKESLIVNLELSEESFKYYNVKYDIIQIEAVRRIRPSQRKNHSKFGRRE